jgi:predicted RNase H-like HicB family nuclease
VKYTVVLQKTDEGVSVGCPALPGCWSEGRTEQEALENIKDAIREYLAAVQSSLGSGEIREAEESPSHDQRGMVRPLGTSSADRW